MQVGTLPSPHPSKRPRAVRRRVSFPWRSERSGLVRAERPRARPADAHAPHLHL